MVKAFMAELWSTETLGFARLCAIGVSHPDQEELGGVQSLDVQEEAQEGRAALATLRSARLEADAERVAQVQLVTQRLGSRLLHRLQCSLPVLLRLLATYTWHFRRCPRPLCTVVKRGCKTPPLRPWSCWAGAAPRPTAACQAPPSCAVPP